MSLTDIEILLADRLGFDIDTVGLKAVAAMVERAMERAGFSDLEAYVSALRREPEAWEGFVDQIVVPETWFFRDVAPFELAVDLIRPHLHLGSNRVTRVLSCPCSTGEEPYSLVLSMLHAGALPESFRVDAVDVSRRALQLARAAVFNSRSFRGDFPADHEPYFDRSEKDGSRRLNATARACVTFRQGNIVAPDFLKDEAPYDVLFCRNLLIYLHPVARIHAMAALRRLLAEDGVLVLGHAETAFAREHGFRPTGPSGAFAFVRSRLQLLPPPMPKKGHPGSHAENRTEHRSPLTNVRTPVVKPLVAVLPLSQPVSEKEAQTQPPALSPLAMASQLGDAGQLHSALRVCSEYLQSVPDSPEGYFLLGVLHDALGHLDLAASSFRKVLYLDPNHPEALLCLALKQEARGDSSGAALLRERARRAQQANKMDNP